MARFSHKNFQPATEPLRVSEDGKTVFLNREDTLSASIAGVSVTIDTDRGCSVESSHTRAVVTAPDGTKVLPYFLRDGHWRVVLVEQFRIAVGRATLEAAGGGVEGDEDPRLAMARELREEAGIHVRAEDIRLVYASYIQPPVLTNKACGGIIEIKEDQLPSHGGICGEIQLGEYTLVTIQSFVPLLKARDAGDITLDLETSCLLDAVAEAVGLIQRFY